MKENETTEQVIGGAVEVHRALGPGLLEGVQEECPILEWNARRLAYERQKPLPIVYKGLRVKANLKLDFLVSGLVIVELKSVEELAPVHEAQRLTDLRLTGLQVGLLINFNVPVLRSGIKRMVNNFIDSAPRRLCGES